MIERFIHRLNLPSESKVIIKSVTKLNAPENQQPVLELYHTIRSLSTETKSIVESIVKTGFRESVYGNKGYGVYLSSHSSYGLRWVGSTPGMIICYVNYNDPTKIKRFIAEIPPGYEYVVQPEIITPAYFVEYKLIGPNGNQGWLKLGESGCEPCDKKKKRCDCPMTPSVYPFDNVVYGHQ